MGNDHHTHHPGKNSMGIKKLNVFILSRLIFTSNGHKVLLALKKRWGTACR